MSFLPVCVLTQQVLRSDQYAHKLECLQLEQEEKL
jgi:hypothetical protein